MEGGGGAAGEEDGIRRGRRRGRGAEGEGGEGKERKRSRDRGAEGSWEVAEEEATPPHLQAPHHHGSIRKQGIRELKADPLKSPLVAIQRSGVNVPPLPPPSG